MEVAPLSFGDHSALVQALRGADTLFNTYWIRFPRGPLTFAQAVENSRRLFAAAREAGVRRVVHVSITHPALDSDLPYFRGKAQVEQALAASGLSYALLRPTVLFGDEGILVNNLAWLLRRLPVFAVPGRGDYRLQPIFVGDLADLALQAAASEGNLTWDAAGPEGFSFRELLAAIGRAVGRPRRLVSVPPGLALVAAGALGRLVGDVLMTRDELRGLQRDLLVSAEAPRGTTRLGQWLTDNGEWLGRNYMSEVRKHYR